MYRIEGEMWEEEKGGRAKTIYIPNTRTQTLSLGAAQPLSAPTTSNAWRYTETGFSELRAKFPRRIFSVCDSAQPSDALGIIRRRPASLGARIGPTSLSIPLRRARGRTAAPTRLVYVTDDDTYTDTGEIARSLMPVSHCNFAGLFAGNEIWS